jgi:hypothetical protein
MYVES